MLEKENLRAFRGDISNIKCPKCGEGWTNLTEWKMWVNGENVQVCIECKDNALKEWKERERQKELEEKNSNVTNKKGMEWIHE